VINARLDIGRDREAGVELFEGNMASMQRVAAALDDKYYPLP
jgi:hypothetical protein